MLPIWLLYFLPPLSLMVLGAKFVLVGLAAVIPAILLHLSEWSVVEMLLKGWGFGILADAVGLGVFFAVFALNVEMYDSRYPLICTIAFFVVVILAFLLHYRFGFKKCEFSIKRRIWMSVMLAVAAAPYFFFIPE